MNDRPTALLLIAIALAGYGLYIAAYVPAMLVGQPVPLLLIGFVLQVVCAVAAAVAITYRATSVGESQLMAVAERRLRSGEPR